ncbi:hypothetical protein VCUG_00499 [Vavraia culicis subsp. floridensis]|uniref:Glutaredoxin domain-containing protein n=1 Tax=Vavraia culicis (isolate floridensis) TaxID=948595 RepID=L2GWM5_VAVCU|nr:uncharacterized protein VCUG_00499 [Vavraia culicis subsp. floridensis]ELA48076.1 hypothetical protein VCUG_00499 [Vavraia culicis subsp. floridensis]
MMDEPHCVYVNLNKNYVKEHKLSVICGMKDCEDCIEAHKLLKEKSIDVKCACMQMNPVLVDETEKEYGHRTFPIIFVNGEFVGGYADLRKKFGCK